MDKEHFSFGLKMSKTLIREVQRSILTTGMTVIFGIVCLQYASQGRFDQILPFVTGLMGMIIGHFFARRGMNSANQDDAPGSEG
jgi:uncharacterized protein YneF (UPF0154 family)